MEGDLIKINKWLLPLSYLYGMGVSLRNQFFEMGVLKEKSYNIPIISVGNITVGGTGKTPMAEYLIRLLHNEFRVGVVSRGYKRLSKGFVLADSKTSPEKIGDEPYQIKKKFEDVTVAVDKNRRRAIEKLTNKESEQNVEVIILDDAFQHRYVKPGINILLVDYHRMVCEDSLLPAGRLREPVTSMYRAGIVVVTKCPPQMNPMEFRVIKKQLKLYPFQRLYYAAVKYNDMQQLFGNKSRSLKSLQVNEHVLLLSGIATPEQMRADLEQYTKNIVALSFPDHHYFTAQDVKKINAAFAALPAPKFIVVTEKDAVRMHSLGLSKDVRASVYVLPIEVSIMQDKEKEFNENILSYVRKNKGNGELSKG